MLMSFTRPLACWPCTGAGRKMSILWKEFGVELQANTIHEKFHAVRSVELLEFDIDSFALCQNINWKTSDDLASIIIFKINEALFIVRYHTSRRYVQHPNRAPQWCKLKICCKRILHSFSNVYNIRMNHYGFLYFILIQNCVIHSYSLTTREKKKHWLHWILNFLYFSCAWRREKVG